MVMMMMMMMMVMMMMVMMLMLMLMMCLRFGCEISSVSSFGFKTISGYLKINALRHGGVKLYVSVNV